jgi:hypothetical protein
MNIPDWTGANCAGVDQNLFFPSGQGTIEHDVRMVRQLCIACDLYRKCLGYAVTREPIGIWAGYGPAGLRGVRKKTGAMAGLDRDQALDVLVSSHQTVLSLARRVPVRELKPGDFTLDRNGDPVKIMWVGKAHKGHRPSWFVSLPATVMVLRRPRPDEQ